MSNCMYLLTQNMIYLSRNRKMKILQIGYDDKFPPWIDLDNRIQNG